MTENQLAVSARLTRRGFLRAGAGAVLMTLALPRASIAGPQRKRVAFQTRGVVLIPQDLTWQEWPQRAARTGLNTLALHHGRSVFQVARFVHSDAGQRFLRETRRQGLRIEYELHAMSDLLPRTLFDDEQSMFRMNEQGQRVRDWNLCVHSARALEVVGENAVAIARLLPPNTGRYFYWGDDGQPWCRCPQCRGYSDSEQALLLENELIARLRRFDTRAQLAHLAYANTLSAPVRVRPAPGVFLEYAPIGRRYDLPYAEQPAGTDALTNLDANLRVFPAGTAQVLEYWLDVSRFSSWQRPAKELPWNREVFLADLETYAARGIRHITSFACYIDGDYVKRYGEPGALADYAAGLKRRTLLKAPQPRRF